jgi:hypothetical protein
VALLVAGDFNTWKLKSVLPNLYQHVKCATRGKTILDHCTPHTETLTKLSLALHLVRPQLYPPDSCLQKLKQEAPVTRSIKKWSDEADAKLQDCVAITVLGFFR